MPDSINESEVRNILRTLSETCWDNVDIVLYVGYRKKQIKKKYHILQVSLGENIIKFFKKNLKNCISSIQDITVDIGRIPSNRVPLVKTVCNSLNLRQLISCVKDDEIDLLNSYDMLLKGDFYILEVQIPNMNNQLYAVRKIEKDYNTKKSNYLSNLLFSTGILIDMVSEQVFKLDKYLDFLSYGSLNIILNRKNYEYILYVHDELIKRRDDLVSELAEQNIIANKEQFCSLIGDNMRHLRKIDAIGINEYYRDPNYVYKMRNLITDHPEWNILLNEEQQIIVSKENLSGVFSLLSNNRLRSDITDVFYDTESKRDISNT